MKIDNNSFFIGGDDTRFTTAEGLSDQAREALIACGASEQDFHAWGNGWIWVVCENNLQPQIRLFNLDLLVGIFILWKLTN